MARFPVQTTLPGLKGVNVSFLTKNSGEFIDRLGDIRRFKFEGTLGGPDPYITIVIDDGSMCSFKPWPNYPTFWCASGLFVCDKQKGIGTAIYACISQILECCGCRIAPSEQVTDQGKDFWSRLDPEIKWELVEDEGCNRPDLTGLQQPA